MDANVGESLKATEGNDLETLGESMGDAFVRIGPEKGPCLGGCGRKTPLAHLGQKAFQTYCRACEADADRRREADEREEIVRRLIDRANAPKRMRVWSLATFPTDEDGLHARGVAEQWLSNYMAGTRRNLILHGGVGCGKTGLAWGICRALCEEQIACRFVNFVGFLAELRQAIGEGRNVRDDWRRVPVLVLDDVGAERPTEFARQELVSLVDYRWAEDLPTIFTSNLPLMRLAARLSPEDPDFVEGKRIVSRMQDGAVIAHITGPDRRMAR